MRLLAGDGLDMVAPLRSVMPIARVRRRAAVAPCEGESPGPLRTLPVTALAHAPGAAVLIRFTLPCAGTLDVGALSQRLAELAVPSALLDALVRALRVARMDRAGGGLRWAAPTPRGAAGSCTARHSRRWRAMRSPMRSDPPSRAACASGSTKRTRTRSGPGGCAAALRTIRAVCC